jgi:hypothetical protein
VTRIKYPYPTGLAATSLDSLSENERIPVFAPVYQPSKRAGAM